MANIVPEESNRFENQDELSVAVGEYVRIKESMSQMESRSKELRDKIFASIDAEGELESSGSYSLYLDSEIEGVVRLEKQRRAIRKINEERADAIIEETGIGDDVYEMKRVINEDNLMAAMFQGKITEEQLDAMFPATIVWALRTLKK